MNRARILVADDQPNLRWMVRTNLTRRGFDVLEASDGEEALAKVAAESPDLLVLDVMMPKMDGFEVLQHLRQVPGTRSIPVIFLTAKASERDRVEGLSLGAHDYISKPFSLQELYLRINRLLETQAQISRLVEYGQRDASTGLPNRVQFELRLREAWADDSRDSSLIFMTFQNLDELTAKAGLDQLDEALNIIADSVMAALPEEAEAFWIAGNHLAVLVPWGEAEAAGLEATLVERLRTAFGEVKLRGIVDIQVGLAERVRGERIDEFVKRAARNSDEFELREGEANVVPLRPRRHWGEQDA